MDRGLSKVCRLPLFNAQFSAMLIVLGITSVEFVAAFPATTGVQFSHAVMNLAPAMTSKMDDAESKRVLELVTESGDLLELFVLGACRHVFSFGCCFVRLRASQ